MNTFSTTASLSYPSDFPALFRMADMVSLRAQRRFLVALKLRLGGLVAAAVGGALGWSLASIKVGGLVAFIGFSVALGSELYGATLRPDKMWYEGRAAAESAKTLTWRYAIGGKSFSDLGDANADEKFVRELNATLEDLDVMEAQVADSGLQITPAMRRMRMLTFEERRKIYITQRIQEQQEWYSRKAAWNEARGHAWIVVGIVLEFLGVLGGALRAFTSFEVDLFGVFGALAAAAIAWTQANQHQNLATAYSVTALELASVASEAEGLTQESAWGQFVGDAEEAISREHTLWRASRGLRMRLPRRAV